MVSFNKRIFALLQVGQSLSYHTLILYSGPQRPHLLQLSPRALARRTTVEVIISTPSVWIIYKQVKRKTHPTLSWLIDQPPGGFYTPYSGVYTERLPPKWVPFVHFQCGKRLGKFAIHIFKGRRSIKKLSCQICGEVTKLLPSAGAVWGSSILPTTYQISRSNDIIPSFEFWVHAVGPMPG